MERLLEASETRNQASITILIPNKIGFKLKTNKQSQEIRKDNSYSMYVPNCGTSNFIKIRLDLKRHRLSPMQQQLMMSLHMLYSRLVLWRRNRKISEIIDSIHLMGLTDIYGSITQMSRNIHVFNTSGNLPKTDHILEYETNLNPDRKCEISPCILCAYPGWNPK